YHEFQSGSSFVVESMPMSFRFFVMICSEATQSDQPEITWGESSTALPLGSIRLPPLYENPLSVSSFFAAVGLYVASCFAADFTFGSVTQLGKSPFSPIASVGGA